MRANFSRRAFAASLLIAILPLGLIGCAQPGTAKATPAEVAHLNYLPQNAINLLKILPKPTADKDPILRSEGDLVLAIQAQASDAAKDRAKAEDTFTPWTYADVLGPGFAKEKLPLTSALLDKVEQDTRASSDEAKRLWDRVRPPKQDIRITPMLKVPGSASYPSGHATRAIVWARLLGALDPAHKDALRERARLVALDRVIGGVHYPSDVVAGMTLGDALADQFLASPAFQADLAKAKAEWAH
jgi:acid phosphatase (class A)